MAAVAHTPIKYVGKSIVKILNVDPVMPNAL
jgi:hypothetical protein